MASLPSELAGIARDPVLAYALLAATLLAVVSLFTGLARLDVVSLLRPRTLLRVAGAVTAAFLLTVLATVLARTGAPGPVTALLTVGARFPLYVVALAYGPSAGLVAAALFAGFAAGDHLPGWSEAILALELVVLGWLAIYPSPRSSRWAGPFDAALAYLLAWGTAGLALLEATDGAVTAPAVWAQHHDAWPGVAVSVLLLALIRPEAYAAAFPHSRIAPAPAEGEARGADVPRAAPGLVAEEVVVDPAPSAARAARAARRERGVDAAGPPHPEPLPVEREARRTVTLTHPDLPRTVVRGRRRRELEPLPWPLEDEPA